ncbi:hypothetical protein M8J77_020204 [Diaphorina citri]|nr:hypothetical protein M8J77_020204 [Diaphorina citri]
MNTAILPILLLLPTALSIWPISYKIQTVEKEYNLDLFTEDDKSTLEMIPPIYYNQIRKKITFLKLRPKKTLKRVTKKKKYKIVEMLKTFWHSKRLWSTRKTNHTNRTKPHKSILKLHNLHKSFLTVKHNGPLRDKKDGNVKTVGRTSQSEQTKHTKNLIKKLIKAQVTDESTALTNTSSEPEETYDALEKEYLDTLSKEIQGKQLFNYTGSQNQTVKEKIVSSIKKPKNCTQESWTAIGLEAMDCLLDDLKHARTMKAYYRVVRQFGRLLAVWTFIVSITVTILWCWRGWCCCCCVCIPWCYPDDVVYNIKRYLVLNPPGRLVRPDGTTLDYNPTEREYFAYQKLKYSVSQYS